MQSKSTRIAYLKRMLKRLEGEETRVEYMVAAGEFTEEGRNSARSNSNAIVRNSFRSCAGLKARS